MNSFLSDEEPRLVSASQGSSVLNTVLYRGRFLYSKYNPMRAVQQTVQGLPQLPGTLFLLCSPCLWHGLEQLMLALAPESEVVAFEADPALHKLAADTFREKKKSFPAEWQRRIRLFGPDSLFEMDSHVRERSERGHLRRAFRVDFSAGTQLNTERYNAVADACQNIIGSFWKNRVTLVRFGRLFSKNLIQNLSEVPQALQLCDVEKTVHRPIVVCGAGGSLESTCIVLNHRRTDFFVLAVDAALPALSAFHIVPDAVVGMEAQLAIEKAYIGAAQSHIPLFMDMASRPNIPRILGGPIIFFASEYTKAAFFCTLRQNALIHGTIPPLGSVGLSATYIAIHLRSSDAVPVYVTGLDFSFFVGATHARETHAHRSRLCCTDRLNPIEQYSASFCEGSRAAQGKDGSVTHTSVIMQSYAKTFRAQFSTAKNLFDAGKTGLELGIPQKQIEPLLQKQGDIDGGQFERAVLKPVDKHIQEHRALAAQNYLLHEHEMLVQLRDLLINGDRSLARNGDYTLEAQVATLLSGREYLYLHFPDGYKLRTDGDFLKRVRAELDSFIKYFAASLAHLSS